MSSNTTISLRPVRVQGELDTLLDGAFGPGALNMLAQTLDALPGMLPRLGLAPEDPRLDNLAWQAVTPGEEWQLAIASRRLPLRLQHHAPQELRVRLRIGRQLARACFDQTFSMGGIATDAEEARIRQEIKQELRPLVARAVNEPFALALRTELALKLAQHPSATQQVELTAPNAYRVRAHLACGPGLALSQG